MKNFKLTKEDGNWKMELTVPVVARRYNPYDEEPGDEYNNIAGLIDHRMSEYGFCHVIDMSYKDKGDQFSSNFIDLSPFMEQEQFEALCNENGIDIIHYHNS